MRIHFLFFTFSATANFDIGTVQLPKPIYLAGPASEHGSPISAGSADWVATSGSPQPLYLNMGTRTGANSYGFPGRGIGEDQQDESFTIAHVGGVKGNETIEIDAFGHSQTFSHVSEIHASGDVGNDTIVVDKGVLSPVFLDGGDGNDALLYDGSGGATLTGGAGGDVIIVGPDAGGVISVDGGADSDYIVDNSSDPTVTIHGGSGDDSITGGYGGGSAHYLYGDDGNDIIASRGPNDAISGGNGDDTITMNMPTGVMTTTIDGGSRLEHAGDHGHEQRRHAPRHPHERHRDLVDGRRQPHGEQHPRRLARPRLRPRHAHGRRPQRLERHLAHDRRRRQRPRRRRGHARRLEQRRLASRSAATTRTRASRSSTPSARTSAGSSRSTSSTPSAPRATP